MAAGELVEKLLWPEVQEEYSRLRARPGLIAAGADRARRGRLSGGAPAAQAQALASALEAVTVRPDGQLAARGPDRRPLEVVLDRVYAACFFNSGRLALLSKFRLSAPMLLALMALFFAVGGASFAADATKSAVKLITGKQVKNSSLTGKDLKDKSLTARDFKGSVRGPAGQTGPAGPAGPAGETGPAGPLSLQYVEGPSVTLPLGTSVTGTVACPDGKSVTGGGATILTIGPDVIMDSSFPSDNASDADSIRDNAWSVAYNNPTGSASSFRVYAICTTPNSKS